MVNKEYYLEVCTVCVKQNKIKTFGFVEKQLMLLGSNFLAKNNTVIMPWFLYSPLLAPYDFKDLRLSENCKIRAPTKFEVNHCFASAQYYFLEKIWNFIILFIYIIWYFVQIALKLKVFFFPWSMFSKWGVRLI